MSYIRSLFGGVGALAALAFLFVLQRLSFKARLRILNALSICIYALWRSKRKKIFTNARLLRPDLSRDELSRGGKEVAKTIASSWAALLGHGKWREEKLETIVDVKGAELVLHHQRNKNRIVIVVVHIGSIDEVLRILPAYGIKAYIPAEAIQPKWLLQFMLRMRSKLDGVVFEPIEKGKTTLRLGEHASKGEAIFIPIDILRNGNNGRGVPCKIGNVKANFPTGAVQVALAKRALLIPVLSSFNVETGRRKISVLEPFEFVRTQNFGNDVKLNTVRLVETIFAPNICQNWQYWMQILWSDLQECCEQQTPNN